MYDCAGTSVACARRKLRTVKLWEWLSRCWTSWHWIVISCHGTSWSPWLTLWGRMGEGRREIELIVTVYWGGCIAWVVPWSQPWVPIYIHVHSGCIWVPLWAWKRLQMLQYTSDWGDRWGQGLLQSWFICCRILVLRGCREVRKGYECYKFECLHTMCIASSPHVHCQECQYIVINEPTFVMWVLMEFLGDVVQLHLFRPEVQRVLPQDTMQMLIRRRKEVQPVGTRLPTHTIRTVPCYLLQHWEHEFSVWVEVAALQLWLLGRGHPTLSWHKACL